MRALTLGFAAACVAMPSAMAQRGSESPGSSTLPTTGLTRAELVRRWDLDGDGTISKSEADIARARMRRQRNEMQLESGIDPVTGRPRGESPGPTEGEEPPPYQLPPEDPPTEPVEPVDEGIAGQPKSTRPKPLAELLSPITTKDPVPGLPRAPSLTGKPDNPSSKPSVERSGRASWLPPARSGTAGLGGPRAGAPPAVSGYGSNAWSDLNAGRFRSLEVESGKSAANAARTSITGGGLLPTVRKPGQTGALVLPGQTSPRRTTQAPLAPPPSRVPMVPPPRVHAEDIGGYGP